MIGNTSDVNEDAKELLGEDVIHGIWLITERPPWYAHYPVTGSILDLLLLIAMSPFMLYSLFRPSNRKTVFGHSGSVYCAKTRTDIALIASKTVSGMQQLTHVLIRKPLSSLDTFDFTNAHNTPVDIAFHDGETITLQLNSVWSDLVEFSSSTRPN